MSAPSASRTGSAARLASLAARGFQVCPASVTVPVELRGFLPDGSGFHLLCRGVRVRLDLYVRDRARWEVPVAPATARPEDAYADFVTRPLLRAGRLDERPDGARLVFADPGNPDETRVFDGTARRGWRDHEAGLLTLREAEDILGQLMTHCHPPKAA